MRVREEVLGTEIGGEESIIPEELVTEIGAKMAKLSVHQPKEPVDLGAPPPPIVEETLNKSLDDAANLFINLLSPSISNYVKELAETSP